ncbi:MAG: aldehyde dehydrogenase family protein [Rhizomicrobium sp.]
MDTSSRIGAAFEAGQGAPEKIINPRTGQTIVEIPEASDAQVDSAVAAASKAFDGWSRTTPGERSAMLLKLADLIERDADAYADLESLNCGKPRHLVLADEIPGIVDCFRFFAGAVRTMHGPVAGEYLPGFTSMVRCDPVGVRSVHRAVEITH